MTKILNYFVLQMISASFLMPWWQNIHSSLTESAITTVIRRCQNRRLCSSWYFSTIPANAAWSTSTWRPSASTCDTCIRMWPHTTDLLSWNAMWPSHWHFDSVAWQGHGPQASSPPPPHVCGNQRIHIHKHSKGIAQQGKCSMDWFFGFKLPLICNERSE